MVGPNTVKISAHRAVCMARSGYLRNYLLTYGDAELQEARDLVKKVPETLVRAPYPNA